LLTVVEAWVPDTYAAFCDYRLGAVTLSRQAAALVKARLRGDTITQETSGLSLREWRELEAWLAE
jgi:thymidylate synthase (FAD)